MLRSTFLGYKTATSALKVNQSIMDVVGQNISNINTKGYTRQRLDINSVSLGTSNMKLGTTGVVIGQGVEANGVSQLRDEFLDARYRTEAAKTGSQDVQLEAMQDLELVFDEISKDGLDAQFSDLLTQFHSLTSSPSDPVLEGVVRTSAQMLTQMFNDYSKQIDTIRGQQLSYLKDGAIENVNTLTENIAKLNQQIKEDNISGNPALELNDERNLLIDELSNYIDIEVNPNPIDIGGGKTVNELSINLKLADNKKVNIVNNNVFAKFKASVPDDKTDVKVELEENIDSTITTDDELKDLDLTNYIESGQIGGYIKFLNGKGEFAAATDLASESENKGVQYYQKMLDTLANKFASDMNELNKKPISYDDITGNPTYDDTSQKDLFDARGGGVITAGNIKITKDWADSTDSYITNTIIKSAGDDTTGATDNILRMISKFQNKESFDISKDTNNDGDIDDPGDKFSLFKGTFQEFLSFTTTSLNLQVSNVETSYDTYNETMLQIDYARSSMSSVDLNEEGVNLLQYSKSYNAAARLMTTLDEMLDTLINRMGV